MLHLSRQIHGHLVKHATKIIIIPHKNPDGDALGSATAFMGYLNHLKKDAQIFCVTPVAEKWHFLEHSKHITTDPNVFQDPNVNTIVVLDSGDLPYAGVDKLLAPLAAKIINIDHHATNNFFGHFNLVLPAASSTTEVLYNFFKHNYIPFTKNMATSLLTGFITDTDNFSNSATSAEALAAASDLIRQGARLNAVTTSTIKNKSIETLRMWGEVLSRLKRHEALGLAYTYITRSDLQKYNFTESEGEGIANFLNNLGDTQIALILKETLDGHIKGSFRTTHDDVDVSEIAKKMGGGGHKKAAGFTTSGTIDEVLQKILTI
jgi:phosphoesterase RecJ-like protein